MYRDFTAYGQFLQRCMQNQVPSMLAENLIFRVYHGGMEFVTLSLIY